MANKLQIKRTTVSGRTPNTTNSGNTHFIDTGELALNLTDGKMFSSNGTVSFEVGANLENISITSNATFGSSGKIIANGSFGTNGQVLSSNGTAMYWETSSGSGTVTQVNTGIGLTGGSITTTGTISVVANNGIIANSTGVFANAGTGIVANATGIHVNSSYIATISANNTSFLGGIAAASYVQNTDSRTLSGNLVISGTSFLPSSNTILLGDSTNRWVLSANTGSFSGAVSGITTLAAGNTTVTGFANASVSVNSALLTVGTSFIANTTGAFHTGTVNAASFTVGTSFIANSSFVTIGETAVKYATFTTSSISQVAFDTFAAATYRSAKYMVQMTSGAAYHAIELSLIHDGTTVYLAQYGEVKSGASLGTFDASITSGTLSVLITPANSVTVVKSIAKLIAV